MRTLARRLALTAGIIACGGVTLPAQWRDVVTKGVPLTPAGTPNYGAPAPKLADGKTPDLTGIWEAEKRPCNEATNPLGCLDALFGIGWTRNAIKVGDVVTIDGSLARNGTNLVNARTILLAGKKMFAGSSEGNRR